MHVSKFVKKGSITVIVLMLLISLILILISSLITIFIYATGRFLLYYFLLYLLTLLKVQKTFQKIIDYLLLILFLIPLIWLLIDFEGFINIIMIGIHLDMR